MRLGPTCWCSLAVLVLAAPLAAQGRPASRCAPPTILDFWDGDWPPLEFPRDSVSFVYPAELRAAGIEGVVRLRYVVCQDGVVDPASVRLVRASHMGFVPAAVWMLASARHVPRVVAGRPVSREVNYTVRFVLPPRDRGRSIDL